MLEPSFDRHPPKISILLVTFNCLDYTKLCLDSVRKNTDYPNFELIIVDNASSDGTVEFLDQFTLAGQDVIRIKNKANLGFAAANNLGARSASGDYLVLLNNDTIVTAGWLQGLLRHLQKDASVGMVGPVTNDIGNEARIRVNYPDLAGIDQFAARRAEKYYGRSFSIRVLALYCAMLSKELYLRLGGLDERFRVGMFEDDDLALKIEREGLHLICAADVFVHHFHAVSFKQLPYEEMKQIFIENRKKFEDKWGIKWKVHRHRWRWFGS